MLWGELLGRLDKCRDALVEPSRKLTDMMGDELVHRLVRDERLADRCRLRRPEHQPLEFVAHLLRNPGRLQRHRRCRAGARDYERGRVAGP